MCKLLSSVPQPHVIPSPFSHHDHTVSTPPLTCIAVMCRMLKWLVGCLLCLTCVNTTYINKNGVHKTPSRFAYVCLHYEGTPSDDEYLLGLRTLIHSIHTTDTQNDIVVLLSTNVRDSTKQQLLDDGVVIKIINNIYNPFKNIDSERSRSYKPRFEHTFNKLYLWSMTEYERVIYMDSDNIVMYNADHLFFCGHFCVIFMNPLLFHTGLLVVKPDEHLYQRLLINLQDTRSYSYDGADQGFLVGQFDVQDAPLFDPRAIPIDPATNKQMPYDVPEMRLSIQYNLNHFYYYPTMSYDFFRRATQYYFSNYTVPALTLAYPAAPWLKPWYWYPMFFFTQHIHWHHVRSSMPDQQYTYVAVSRLLILAVTYILSYFVLRRILQLDALESFQYRVQSTVQKNTFVAGYAVGVVMWLATSYVAFTSIPLICTPLIAFTTFVLLHIHIMYLLLHGYAILLRNKLNQSVHISHQFNYGILWLSQMMCGAFFLPLYPHFIPKVAVVVFGLFYWCVIQAHLFRKVTDKLVGRH